MEAYPGLGLVDLQIPSNIRYICNNINAEVSQMIGWTHTGEHQKLNNTYQSCVPQKHFILVRNSHLRAIDGPT